MAQCSILSICSSYVYTSDCSIDRIFCYVFSNSVTGESSLDRFTCGLGGKAVLPHIIATIPPMLQHGMPTFVTIVVSLTKSAFT